MRKSRKRIFDNALNWEKETKQDLKNSLKEELIIEKGVIYDHAKLIKDDPDALDRKSVV